MHQRQSQSQITLGPGLFDGYAQLPDTYGDCFENYLDATPTSGTIFVGGGGETLSVDVKVEPHA